MYDISNDNNLVKNCLVLIEEKLNWGSSKKWRHSQFVKLNQRIEEDTRINLSYTTLKRVWGKLEYSGKISITTLDALCNFLGYLDWEDYVSKNVHIFNSIEENKVVKKREIGLKFFFSYILLGILIIGILIFALYFFFHTPIDPDKIVFTADKTIGTIPFTVYFKVGLGDYDKDNFYLVTGDSKSKRSLKITPSNYAGMYLRPGTHTASLYYKNVEIKTISILAETNGWTCLFKDTSGKYSQPISDTGIISEGMLTLGKTFDINQHEFNDVVSNYFYVKRFIIDDQNLEFKIRLINRIADGADECQKIGISLLFEHGFITTSLVKTGCEALAKIHVNNYERSGFKDEGMQCFSTDLNDWQDYKIQMIKGKYSVFMNQSLCFEEQFSDTLGMLYGMRFTFHGSGLRVDYVELSNQDSIVFRDDFKR